MKITPIQLIKKAKDLGVLPNTDLGQNFLIDLNYLNKIVNYADLTSKDTAIEIGTGIGNLTLYLLERSKAVFTIEIDKRYKQLWDIYLSPYIKENRLFIIQKDALKVDYEYIIKANNIKNLKIVANIPYHISTPLLWKLIKEIKDYNCSYTLLVQEEFAQKLVAPLNDKNRFPLTIILELGSKVSLKEKVPPTAFYPKPKVNSRIIIINPKKDLLYRYANDKILIKILKIGFCQRRKKLIKNLKQNLNIQQNKLKEMFLELKIPENIRAEQLEATKWIELKNRLKDVINPD